MVPNPQLQFTSNGSADSRWPQSRALASTAEMLWRRKWYMLGFLTVPLLIGATYIALSQPTYRIGARVLVQQQGTPLDRNRPSDRDKDFLATQAEIIRSPAVVERAAKSTDLRDPKSPLIDPVVLVLSQLKVVPVLGTNVLSLAFRSTDDERGERTVRAVIASYRQYAREAEHESHLKALRLLTRNEKDLRSDLANLEAGYQKLRQQSPLMGQGKDSVSVQRALLTQLGQTLAQAKQRRFELENQLQVVTHPTGHKLTVSDVTSILPVSTGTNLAAVRTAEATAELSNAAPDASAPVSSGNLMASTGNLHEDARTRDLSTIQQELQRAQVKQRELSQMYGKKHPEMRAVQEQVAAWKGLQQEMVDSWPRVLEDELTKTRLQEKRLGELYNDEFEKVKLIDGYVLKEQQAQDSIQRTQTTYQSILTQLKQWQLADQALADGRAGVTVSVLEEPAMAEREDWPPPLLMLGFCGIVGAMGGFGFVTLAEKLESKIRSTQEIEEGLSIPVVGRIPPLAVTEKGSKHSPYYCHVVRQLQDSPVAEAFRGLRAHLQRTLRGKTGRVIQIASPREGEGKTTVTANLAFGLAQLGKKVIAVDADLRGGVLHDVFEVAESKGLSNILAKGAALEDQIQASPIVGVDVLARGEEVDNPGELVARPDFEKLLDSLRHHYDVILLDTPPLLLVTEASVLAPLVDGVLVSLSIGRSSMDDAQGTCEMLENLGVKPMGIVVNEVPQRRSTAYGYRRSMASAGKEAERLRSAARRPRDAKV